MTYKHRFHIVHYSVRNYYYHLLRTVLTFSAVPNDYGLGGGLRYTNGCRDFSADVSVTHIEDM